MGKGRQKYPTKIANQPSSLCCSLHLTIQGGNSFSYFNMDNRLFSTQNKNFEEGFTSEKLKRSNSCPIQIGANGKSCHQVLFYFYFILCCPIFHFGVWWFCVYSLLFSLFLDFVVHLDTNIFVSLVFNCEVPEKERGFCCNMQELEERETLSD